MKLNSPNLPTGGGCGAGAEMNKMYIINIRII
jgi:hypothetical protein